MPSSGEVRELAEALKAEADRELLIVPRRSLPIAERIEQLGVASHQPAIRALGAMTAADALREQGCYLDAVREYDRAGELYLSVEDEVGWARTRLGAAYTRAHTLELGPALAEAERARAVLANHGLWLRLARLESGIGNLLRELGRTQEALLAGHRAVATAERIEDATERELVGAEVRINLARAYQRLDDYERSEQLLREAAATFTRHGRAGPVAIAHSNLARGLIAQGHVSRGLALAQEMRGQMLSLGRNSDAALVGQVAVECLLELNRPAEARDLANDIANELRNNGATAELGKALLQRAIACELLERNAQAAEDLAEAEMLFRQGGLQGWAAVARLHRAEVLERTGDPGEALAEAALARRELHARGHVIACARADLLRASLLHHLGDDVSARAAARSALATARRVGVPLLQYRANRLLGRMADEEGNASAALRAFAGAITALETTQSRILTEQRAAFLLHQDKMAVYASAVRLSVQRGQLTRAFGYAERGKARALLDALALRAAGAHDRVSTPAQQNLRDQLTRLRRRYDRLSSTLFEPRPTDELGGSSAAGHSEILQAELARCESRIKAVLEALRQTDTSSIDRLERLQGKIYSPRPFLDPRTALLEYVIDGDRIFIFIVRRGRRIQVRSAPPGATAQIVRLRRMLELNVQTVLSGARGAAMTAQAKALLQRLYALLIQPARPLIEAAERLVVVPHGVLHGMPFAALYDGARFLPERFELVVEPSASAIAFCMRERHRNGGLRAVAIGHSADGQLPGTLREVETVAASLGAECLVESAATIEAVRNRMERTRIAHIAAHGKSRPDAPLFSYLRLADGMLTALDCLDLELECELVTLSACDSGHAVVAAGDEPIGLTRSLLYAGARSVLQSLWRVDDAATERLMARIYAQLGQGLGRAAALRRAQCEFLTTPQAHPAFWAGFTLVGDWSPLQ